MNAPASIGGPRLVHPSVFGLDSKLPDAADPAPQGDTGIPSWAGGLALGVIGAVALGLGGSWLVTRGMTNEFEQMGAAIVTFAAGSVGGAVGGAKLGSHLTRS